VDLVVHLSAIEIAKLTVAFPEADYHVPPLEIIAEEIRNTGKGHFNVIHADTGFKADFYPARSDPRWAWAWQRRRRDAVDGHPTYFAPPEYVILSKLEFFREGGSEKHLRDIRGMLAVSGENIDRACSTVPRQTSASPMPGVAHRHPDETRHFARRSVSIRKSGTSGCRTSLAPGCTSSQATPTLRNFSWSFTPKFAVCVGSFASFPSAGAAG